jgi:hypothetical protein
MALLARDPILVSKDGDGDHRASTQTGGDQKPDEGGT